MRKHSRNIIIVCRIDKEDEIDCLLTGCNFLLKNIPDEAFYYQRHAQPEYQFEPVDTDNMFPYLLVNIGSGTSILKVDSETKYERVGGSSIGGGTFWGLGSRMTGARVGQGRDTTLLIYI